MPTWLSPPPKGTGLVMANGHRARASRLLYISWDVGVCLDPELVPSRERVSLGLSVAIFSSPRRELTAELSQQQREHSQGPARLEPPDGVIRATTLPQDGKPRRSRVFCLINVGWMFLSPASDRIRIHSHFSPRALLSCQVSPPVDILAPSLGKRPLSP